MPIESLNLVCQLPDFGWQTLTIASGIVIAVQSCAIASVFHALRHVRTSQAAVGWTVALLTLPIVTLPLYWVFARHRFQGYREAIREVGARHERSVSAIRSALSTGLNERSTEGVTPLERVADVLDTPITAGNDFELLVDGEATFEAIVKATQAAQRYIYISFFIIRDDHLGCRLAEALIERARAGVTIRILYDEVGSHRLGKDYLRRLREAGIEIRSFNTRQGWVNRFQINFRNHRKIVLIDGQYGIVGGLNVGNEYLGTAAGMEAWRDTAVLVRGPVARQVQAVFAGDYYWAVRHDLIEADWESPLSLFEVTVRGAVCATGPADVRPRATMMYAAAAEASRERLWISTPYLVPNEAVVVALHMAKARGVDVRIMIPDRADHFAVFLAGFYYEQELGEANIPVYRYKTGFLHQKCVLVDDELALIGSTNLDNRSLHLNFELMIACEGSKIVGDVTAMLERDFANSTLSNTGDAPARPWFQRAGTAVARLFSPVL
jgi:cardiolipin synthase